MTALQVRDLPEDIYEKLKECAAYNHRSIAQQTTAFIEEGLIRQGYYAGKTPDAPIIAAGLAVSSSEPAAVHPSVSVSRGIGAGLAYAFEHDIQIPPAVREASARARDVSPFSWAAGLEFEPEEVLQARCEKRRRLIEEIKGIEWGNSLPTVEETIAMIREERENWSLETIESVESYLHERKLEREAIA